MGRYLKYAIGEIILVVIGILIAVGINSLYEDHQNDLKVKNILRQIQEEITTDIIDARRIYNRYITDDSLTRRILMDSLTVEDIVKNNNSLTYNNSYVSFSNKTSGYTQLIRNIDNLPPKYKPVLPHLIDLYVEKQNDIDDYNEFIKNQVVTTGAKFFKDEPRAYEYSLRANAAQAALYFLNDPYHKNRKASYITTLGTIAMGANDYRLEGILTYRLIDSLIGKPYPEASSFVRLLPSAEVYTPFLGSYKSADYLNDNLSIRILLENDVLIMESPFANEEGKSRLIWHEDEYYFGASMYQIIKLTKDQRDNQVVEISDGLQKFTFIKQ